MADNEKDITIEELPEPISDQDMLLHNIIDGTPDISDLEPNSRQEVYLKYIALNGGGGGGGGSSVNVVQGTGDSTTDVMSQKAVTDEIDKLGTSAYCDTGTSNGNVPILNSNGKLPNSVIPSLAITDTFVATNEEEMLNIEGAEKGDICIRTDENKTYILDETPARYSRSASRTSLSDWIELQTPTDEVSSVNGQKGEVVLTAGDVDSYTKTEIDAKVPTIVQKRGTSTTSVMSQNAVSTLKVFGSNATSASNTGIVIGNSAKSIGTNHIVIGNTSNITDGNTAETQSSQNIAIGYNARCVASADNYSAGSYSIAIGSNARTGVNNNCISIGKNSYSNNISAISIGDGCITSVNANYSVSLGTNAKTSATQSVSIGNSAICSSSYSVSLGAYSTAPGASVISVGDGSTNANYGTRRIVNVKDPVNAQDAATKNYVDTKVAEAGSGVNVVQTTGESEADVMSQNAVTNALTLKVDAVEGKGLSTEDFTTEYKEKLNSIPNITVVQTTGQSTTDVMSQKAVTNNTCFGENAQIAENSGGYAFGNYANAGDTYAMAFGFNAKATGYGSISFGESSRSSGYGSSAFGKNSNATASNSVALGNSSIASEDSVVSVGNPNLALNPTRRIVNVTDPVNNQDAATKKYVDDKLSGSGGEGSVTVVQITGTSETDVMSQKAVSENTCFGYGATSTSNASAVFGVNANSIGSDSSAFGNSATATGLHSSAFGHSAKATAGFSSAFGHSAKATSDVSVALGAYSKATEASVISVGDGSANADYGTRRIVNVKDPVNAQDAVTKNYLDGDILYSAANNTFDDGLKTGTATLSQDISNYQYIEVSAVSDNGDFKTERVYTGGLSSIRYTFNVMSYSTTQMKYYHKMVMFQITESTVSIENQNQHCIAYDTSGKLDTSGCESYAGVTVFAITRVVGYK